jgi:hypothetical protein
MKYQREQKCIKCNSFYIKHTFINQSIDIVCIYLLSFVSIWIEKRHRKNYILEKGWRILFSKYFFSKAWIFVPTVSSLFCKERTGVQITRWAGAKKWWKWSKFISGLNYLTLELKKRSKRTRMHCLPVSKRQGSLGPRTYTLNTYVYITSLPCMDGTKWNRTYVLVYIDAWIVT